MDCSLATQEILDLYLERWTIEVLFREAKQKLALDKYQIRSSRGIRRYWLLMPLAHFVCCTGTGKLMPLQDGLSAIQSQLYKERITYIYQCGATRETLKILLALVA